MKQGTCEGGVATVVNSASPPENEKAQYAITGVSITSRAKANPHSLYIKSTIGKIREK